MELTIASFSSLPRTFISCCAFVGVLSPETLMKFSW